MLLKFESLHELEDFVFMAGYIHRSKLEEYGYVYARESERVISGEKLEPNARCVGGDNQDDPRVPPLPIVQSDEGDEPDPEVQRTPARRKRRTKAEIEAEKAAVAEGNGSDGDRPSSAGADPFAVTAEAGATTTAPADPVPTAADDRKAQIAAMANLYDGTDKLAHLNEGRAFIEKHGFPAYNETLALAGVPSNIAGHTPEQVSLHRAAMALLGTPSASKD